MQRSNSPELYGPCPCGSGRKYKFCCRDRDREAMRRGHAGGILQFPRRGSDGSVRADIHQPDLDLADAERLNAKALAALKAGKYAVAEGLLRRFIDAAPAVPSGWNNLAFARFAQGDVRDAVRIQEEGLRTCVGANVFGRANLVQFLLTVGRETDAQHVADLILAVDPDTTDEQTKTCEALARLRRHEDILQYLDASAFDPTPAASWFAGIAAANLGRFRDAAAHLRKSGATVAARERAQDVITEIEARQQSSTADGTWSYFQTLEILPRLVYNRIVGYDGEMSDRSLMNTGVFVDFIAAVLNESNGTMAESLGLLEAVDHPRAAELLETIATGTFGTDALRLVALRCLTAKGTWSSTEPHSIFVGGEWRQIDPPKWTVSAEHPASSCTLSDPHLGGVFKQMKRALHAGDYGAAEKLGRELVAECPDFTPSLYHLAVALLGQEQDDEAEVLFRQAMAAEPDYVLPACGLVILLLRRDRVDEARRVLDEVVIPTPVHPDALAGYLLAQVRVCLREEDGLEAAASWLDMIKMIAPDHPGIRDVSVEVAFRHGAANRARNESQRRQRRAEKIRQRKLARNAPLEECFDMYSKTQLDAMARALSLRLRSNLRKAEMREAISSKLRREDTCEAMLRTLDPAEREALDEVLRHGRRMDFEAFSRAYGAVSEEAASAPGRPLSPLDRLKRLGFLVEGTVDGRQSVFVPAEIPL